MPTLRFTLERRDADRAGGSILEDVTPSALVVAGWTGRDRAAIDHHIEELAALGVPRPSQVPLYYRVSAQMVTQATTIEVLGEDSSGEVEPVLLRCGGRWWLTVGSDHTDRRVEAYSVAVSKQMCPKPVAELAWDWDEVEAHQDEIELRSRILEGGDWVDYQRGTLAAIRPLRELIDGHARGADAAASFPEGFLMTCGTLAALPDAAGRGVRPARQMELELHDPRLGRRIVHRYAVRSLPIVA